MCAELEIFAGWRPQESGLRPQGPSTWVLCAVSPGEVSGLVRDKKNNDDMQCT